MDTLAFRAGAVAQQRGWTSPEVIGSDEIVTLEPLGPPVVVLVRGELGVSQAQAVAAVHHAGRPIAVVASDPLDPDVARWLPAEVVDAAVDRSPTSPAHGLADPVHLFSADLDHGPNVSQDLLNEVVSAVVSRMHNLADEHEESGQDCCSGEALEELLGPETEFLLQVDSPPALTALGTGLGINEWLWGSLRFTANADQARDYLDQSHHQLTKGWTRYAFHQWDALVAAAEGVDHDTWIFTFSPATRPDHLRQLVDGALLRDDRVGTYPAVSDYAGDVRCPPEVLDVLSYHSSPIVRLAVAGNPSTARETLLRLSRDQDPTPSTRGTSGQEINAAALANPRFRVDATVAEALRDFAASRPGGLHSVQLASHPDTPIDVLEGLAANDEALSAAVSNALAWNPNTPTVVLDRLTGVEDLVWAERALRDEGPPPLAVLAPFAGDWDEFIELQGGEEQSSPYGRAVYGVRAAQAMGLDLTEGQLREMATSPALMFRLAAVCHRNATQSVLTAALDGLMDNIAVITPECHHP